MRIEPHDAGGGKMLCDRRQRRQRNGAPAGCGNRDCPSGKYIVEARLNFLQRWKSRIQLFMPAGIQCGCRGADHCRRDTSAAFQLLANGLCAGNGQIVMIACTPLENCILCPLRQDCNLRLCAATLKAICRSRKPACGGSIRCTYSVIRSGAEEKFAPIFPTLRLHAYNRPASVAGVFRETFAGRREPAPCTRL